MTYVPFSCGKTEIHFAKGPNQQTLLGRKFTDIIPVDIPNSCDYLGDAGCPGAALHPAKQMCQSCTNTGQHTGANSMDPITAGLNM